MSSNIANKAFKNIKFTKNRPNIALDEAEISENLLNSFKAELKEIQKAADSNTLNYRNLYEFITKYELILPPNYFIKSMIILGQYLIKNSYFIYAKFQCFERIVYIISKEGITDKICSSSINDFVKSLLSSRTADEVKHLVSGLFGYAVSEFFAIKNTDELLVSKSNQLTTLKLLNLVQYTMEFILPNESFAFLIYNGTVSLYLISKELIKLPLAKLAVEPLVWSCCCLQTSVPLLTITNLKWRSTLYYAACQSMFNCGHDEGAEDFARRALFRMQELIQVYNSSDEVKSEENAVIITEATIKIGLMIFKRAVFETRRRPKNYLKPKSKINFKDVLQGNWPRTGTEQMLRELFDSPSQQILAILEALSQQLDFPLGKFRLPAPENDWDILDVYSELFYAALAIITGRCDPTVKSSKKTELLFNVETAQSNCDQLTLAVYKKDTVTIETLYQLLCWSFTFGNWEFWEAVYPNFCNVLPLLTKENKAKEKTLTLLYYMKKVILQSKITDKKSVKLVVEEGKEGENAEVPRSNVGSASSKETKSSRSRRQPSSVDKEDEREKTFSQDPLLDLAKYVQNSLLNVDFEIALYQKEILSEAGNLLWNKVKTHFQTNLDGSLNSIDIQKQTTFERDLYILFVSHRVLGIINYGEMNPITFSEISLRLSVLYEELFSKPDLFSDEAATYSGGLLNSLFEFSEGDSPVKWLKTAQKVLLSGITNVNKYRRGCSLNKEIIVSPAAVMSTHNLDIIYLEMNSIYFRQSVKVHLENKLVNGNKKRNTVNAVQEAVQESKNDLSNKNKSLQALYLGHYLIEAQESLDLQQTQEIVKHIRLLLKTDEPIKPTVITTKTNDLSDKLPPPVLVSKGSDFVVLRVADNVPQNLMNQIGWIRLYGRIVDNPNAEVRLTDDKLDGCGVESQSFSTYFTVYNLHPNENYIFAFAATDKKGNFIGRGMGNSTGRILTTDRVDKIAVLAIITELLHKIHCWNDVVTFSEIIWQHFIEPSVSQSSDADEYHRKYQIKDSMLNSCSLIALRQFCLSVFSFVDAKYKIHQMAVCKYERSQVKIEKLRIKLADRLLALQPAMKKIKDNIMCIEAFIAISYLMIPIMNNNIFYTPFVEILVENNSNLYNVAQTTWLKIDGGLKSCVHQIVACTGRYLLKYFRLNNHESQLADTMRTYITILLRISSNVPYLVQEQDNATVVSDGVSQLDHVGPGVGNNKHIGTAAFRKANKMSKSDLAAASAGSIYQISFDSFKCMIAKQAEHQYSGSEDIDVLYSLLATASARTCYKEVVKFSRKTGYLQVVVDVLSIADREGNFDFAITVYRDIREWLRRRNEAVLGRSLMLGIGHKAGTTLAGADQSATLMGDLDTEGETTKRSIKAKRKTKYKPVSVKANMSDMEKQQREAAELHALLVLETLFYPYYKQVQKRRRFRQISKNELFGRVKMNLGAAMAYTGQIHAKTDALIQLAGLSTAPYFVPDITKYMLDGTGTVIDFVNTVWLGQQSDYCDSSRDGIRTYRSDSITMDKKIVSESQKIVTQWSDLVSKLSLLLRRSFVLAERSGQLILLSSTCEQAVTILTELIKCCCRAKSASSKIGSILANTARGNDTKLTDSLTLSIDKVFNQLMPAFYHGAEAVMNMYQQSDRTSFENNFNKNFMERFILKSIHLLYHGKAYEKLIHTILRFNSFSDFKYISIFIPLFNEAKTNLITKIEDYRKVNYNWATENSFWGISNTFEKLNIPTDSALPVNKYDIFLLTRNKVTKSDLSNRNFKYPFTTTIVGGEGIGSSKKMNNQQQIDLTNKRLMSVLEENKIQPPMLTVPLNVDWAVDKDGVAEKEQGSHIWTQLHFRMVQFRYYQTYQPDQRSPFNVQQLLNELKQSADTFASKGLNEYRALALMHIGNLCMEFCNKNERSTEYWTMALRCLTNIKTDPLLEKLSSMLKLQSNNEEEELITNVYDCRQLMIDIGGNPDSCILIGVLLSQLARYQNYNGDQQTEFIVIASLYFKCLFSVTMAHPKRDVEYFDYFLPYNLGNPQPLIPKFELMKDVTKFDLKELESTLWYLITSLVDRDYNIFVQPLIVLYEHLAFVYLKSPERVLQIKLIRLETAIRAKRFDVATNQLYRILTGIGLPLPFSNDTIDQLPSGFQFSITKHLLNQKNLQTLDKIMTKRLSSNLSAKFDNHINNRISVLHAELLCAIADCIPVSSIDVDIRSLPIVNGSKTAKKGTTKKGDIQSTTDEEGTGSYMERLSFMLEKENPNQLTLPEVKGLLLSVAYNILLPLTEDFLYLLTNDDIDIWQMSSSDAYVNVLALLTQSRVLQLRRCSRAAARLALFGTKIINEYIHNNDDIQADYFWMVRRIDRRLNFDLYLRCSLQMTQCLAEEASIGNILSVEDTRQSDVPPLKQCLISLISECDQKNRFQMKAIFINMLAEYVIRIGYSVNKYMAVYKESKSIFMTQARLTDRSWLSFVKSKIFHMNVKLSTASVLLKENLLQKSITKLQCLEKIILQKIELLYQKLSTVNSWLVAVDIQNVYDPLYRLLMEVRILIADTAAKLIVESLSKSPRMTDVFLPSIGISTASDVLDLLYSALDLQRAITYRTPLVEVELLLMIGRIERYLFGERKVPIGLSLSRFSEAIKILLLSNNHLGLLKQLLIELALTIGVSSFCNSDSKDYIPHQATFRPQVNTKKRSVKQQHQNTQQNNAEDILRRLGWLALQMASQVGNCVNNTQEIKNSLTVHVPSDVVKKLPLAILFDILGPYQFGEKKMINQSEIQKELQSMPEARIPKDSEIADDQITRLYNTAVDNVSWSCLLSYHELLLKMINNQFISIEPTKHSSLSRSTNERDSSSNITSITTNLFSNYEVFEKQQQLHRFLLDNLSEFSAKCVLLPNKELFEGIQPLIINQGIDSGLFRNCALWNNDSSNPVNGPIAVTTDVAVEDADDDTNKEIIQMDPSYLLVKFPAGMFTTDSLIFAPDKRKAEKSNGSEVHLYLFSSPYEKVCLTSNNTLVLFAVTQEVARSASKADACWMGWKMIRGLSSALPEMLHDLQDVVTQLEVMEQTQERLELVGGVSQSHKKMAEKVSNTGGSSKGPGFIPVSPNDEITELEMKLRRVLRNLTNQFIKKDSESNIHVYFPSDDDVLEKTVSTYMFMNMFNLKLIPFDVNKENVKTLMTAFNPFKPKPPIGNAAITNFILELLQIEIQ